MTAVKQVLDDIDGPAVLVGLSYGGVVVAESGTDPRVAGLVYIAAFAPGKDESVNVLIAAPPPGAPVPARSPSPLGAPGFDVGAVPNRISHPPWGPRSPPSVTGNGDLHGRCRCALWTTQECGQKWEGLAWSLGLGRPCRLCSGARADRRRAGGRLDRAGLVQGRGVAVAGPRAHSTVTVAVRRWRPGSSGTEASAAA
ncbi:hypothetical protein JIG36_41950 [Actinoplanes sp. LDG1-06]|uniref:AB hydrolase-1 domain-containing protein n=1 Tax=Paractinoplanes ovalisporus TaxID=2810368 RepID=A0ABS2AQE4_9ACTN|nr:hypothetical protein [Actinoplanes ovalisporus]